MNFKIVWNFFLASLIVFNTCDAQSQCNALYNGQRLGEYVIYKSTGVKVLDSLINNEYIKLCDFFHLNLPLYYVQEPKEDVRGNAFYFPTEKTICLGKNLIVNMYSKTKNFELLIAVLAHEFGHAVQDTYSWGKNWKYTELHADFLAGFYIGKNNLFKSENDLNTYVNEFYNLGDEYFFDSDHHGTPVERSCSFLEGYMYAQESNSNVFDANQYGFDYVMLNNPCAVRKYKIYQDDLTSGNVGGLKIYSTDQFEYVVYVTKPDGMIYRYPISNQREVDEIIIQDFSINLNYNISIARNSLFTGEIPIFDIKYTPTKGVTKEVVIDRHKAYVNFYDIQERKENYNNRLSHKWQVSTGIYASPQTIKFPLSITVEREIPYLKRTSARINIQSSSRGLDEQTDLKLAYKSKIIGFDLIKYIDIPFVKSAFLGPTFYAKSLLIDNTNDGILNYENSSLKYVGIRFGGKNFLTQHVAFGWDFSFGGVKQVIFPNMFPGFDINFMLGYSF